MPVRVGNTAILIMVGLEIGQKCTRWARKGRYLNIRKPSEDWWEYKIKSVMSIIIECKKKT